MSTPAQDWLMIVGPQLEKYRTYMAAARAAELAAQLADAKERAAMIEIPHFLKPVIHCGPRVLVERRYSLVTGRYEIVNLPADPVSEGMREDQRQWERTHPGKAWE